MVKKTTAAVLVLLTAFLSSCGQNAGKLTRREAQFLDLFDTVTTIAAYTESEEQFRAFSDLVYDSLREYHELYDIYGDYPGVHNIKTVNENAGIAPVKVDRRIIGLLLFAKDEAKKTGGAVNAAMGPVLKIWKRYRDAGQADPEHASLPPMSLLESAAEHTDIEKVVIDEAASTVYLPDPEMSLDVGAVAKGYAVEQVGRLVRERGYTSALISAGGNVYAVGGKAENGAPWNVGVQDPQKAEGLLCTARIKDLALVTSGVYERYYTVNGKSYHHIIDPKTLMPSEYYLSVTVISPDSGLADALSTALFNMPLEKGRAYIDSLPDAGALWVLPDGSRVSSDGFQKYLTP